jgi:hypothetical protein
MVPPMPQENAGNHPFPKDRVKAKKQIMFLFVIPKKIL